MLDEQPLLDTSLLRLAKWMKARYFCTVYDALKTILNVPRVFLPLVLKGCVDWAKENGVELVTEEHMKIINDKRAKEKQKKK